MMTMTVAAAALLLAPLGADLARAPVVRATPMIRVQAGPDWRMASGGYVPDGAIAQGQENNGEFLYVCAAEAFNGRHVGKVRPGFDGCHYGYGGQEYSTQSYEVMVNNPGYWQQPEYPGAIPNNAFQLGYEADMTPLFLCLAPHNGGYQPGKIGPRTGGCNIGYGGRELTLYDYQVYVY